MSEITMLTFDFQNMEFNFKMKSEDILVISKFLLLSLWLKY